MSVKPLETVSFAGETEHHLFRVKSRAKFNDMNARFDFSCNVPVIEDQCSAMSRNVIFAQGADKLHRRTTDPSCAGVSAAPRCPTRQLRYHVRLPARPAQDVEPAASKTGVFVQ
jgi:hypothetical protein